MRQTALPDLELVALQGSGSELRNDPIYDRVITQAHQVWRARDLDN